MSMPNGKQQVQLSDGTRLLLRSLNSFGGRKKHYLLGWLLSCVELLTAYLTPFLFQQLIVIMTEGQTRETMTTFALLCAALAVSVPLIIWGTYWKRTSTAYGKGELRKSLFSHIQALPMQTYYEHTQGDYITRLVNDVDRAVDVFNGYTITGLFKFVLYTLISLTILLLHSWKLALLALFLCVAAFVLSIIFNPRVRKLESGAREQAAQSTSLLMETFRNMPVIRVFLLNQRLEERYRSLCDRIAKRRIQYRRLNGVSEGLIYIFSFCAQPIVFIVGIVLMLRGVVSLADAVYLAGVAAIMADGMMGFSAFTQFIQPSIVACKRVFEIMDLPIEQKAPRADTTAQSTPGTAAISIQNLHFTYGGDTKVLDDLSFEVRENEKIALVGSSGSGKTTVLKLLQALYLPQSGTISFFGKDAQAMSLDEIRQTIAYVPQSPSLFIGTVKENICFGKPDISMQEMLDAAKRAKVDTFIEATPDQYELAISEGGTNLSGGQQQRISIARAIAKDAPILLLDEATSALDTETEIEVQSALDDLMAAKTSIVVAHRLSTVINADRILFMENSRIVEEGSHEELLALDGKYKKMYDGIRNAETETF